MRMVKIVVALLVAIIGLGMLKLNSDNMFGILVAGGGTFGLLYAAFPKLQERAERTLLRYVCGGR